MYITKGKSFPQYVYISAHLSIPAASTAKISEQLYLLKMTLGHIECSSENLAGNFSLQIRKSFVESQKNFIILYMLSKKLPKNVLLEKYKAVLTTPAKSFSLKVQKKTFFPIIFSKCKMFLWTHKNAVLTTLPVKSFLFEVQ